LNYARKRIHRALACLRLWIAKNKPSKVAIEKKIRKKKKKEENK